MQELTGDTKSIPPPPFHLFSFQNYFTVLERICFAFFSKALYALARAVRKQQGNEMFVSFVNTSCCGNLSSSHY